MLSFAGTSIKARLHWRFLLQFQARSRGDFTAKSSVVHTPQNSLAIAAKIAGVNAPLYWNCKKGRFRTISYMTPKIGAYWLWYPLPKKIFMQIQLNKCRSNSQQVTCTDSLPFFHLEWHLMKACLISGRRSWLRLYPHTYLEKIAHIARKRLRCNLSIGHPYRRWFHKDLTNTRLYKRKASGHLFISYVTRTPAAMETSWNWNVFF